MLTYHRVGDTESDPWDPTVFSATGEDFDDQVSYLKRKQMLVTLDEALAFVDGKEKSRHDRCRVLITFDDGYLDNYSIAFPILKSHGAQGVFFLCSDIVGSDYVPWWDHAAYLVKSGSKRKFTIGSPAHLEVNIERDGLHRSIRKVLNFCKKHESSDIDRIIRELKETVGGKELPPNPRRFLAWEHAGEMLSGGMAIGAHTHTHAMLSKLSEDEQRRELSLSRSIINEKLGISVETLAYPYGIRMAFTKQTERIAEELGFRCAFSYYGNVSNRRETLERFNLKRVSVSQQSRIRMRMQTEISRVTGTFWP